MITAPSKTKISHGAFTVTALLLSLIANECVTSPARAMPFDQIGIEEQANITAEVCDAAGVCKKKEVEAYVEKCYADAKVWAPDKAKDGTAIGAKEIIEYCVCAAESLLKSSLAGCPEKFLVINRKRGEDGKNSTTPPYIELVDWSTRRGFFNGAAITSDRDKGPVDCSKISFTGPRSAEVKPSDPNECTDPSLAPDSDSKIAR